MEWKISPAPEPYEETVAFMEARAREIREGTADELVWLLDHPPLFTAGSSAHDRDLLDSLGFPVFKTGRGGQYTYHGPGQRIAYVMLDLKKHGPDVRQYVKNLEHWIIATLADFNVKGFIREGRVGVWVNEKEGQEAWPEGHALQSAEPSGSPRRSGDRSGSDKIKEAKIAALGVRVRQWVTYHGIAINVNPDLTHYRGIVPCGISEYGVTSLAALGIEASMSQLDNALMKNFGRIF